MGDVGCSSGRKSSRKASHEGLRGSARPQSPSPGPLMRRERRLGCLFVLPALLLVFVMYLIPTVTTFVVSFQSADMEPHIARVLDTANLSRIGLDNYRRAFRDTVWRTAMVNTGIYVIVVVLVTVLFSMAVALILNQSFKGRGFLRALILIPWAVPPIVNGTMWGLVFHADIGTLNGVLRTLGIIQRDVIWLGEPRLARLVVITATTWRLIPFVSLLLLAGLQSIPRSIYESAKVDGANALQSFVLITLPNLSMVILTAITLLTLWVTKVFDEIWALTKGGPSYGTTVMNLWTYRQSFEFLRFGYGSALAYIMVFITAMLVLVNFWLRRRSEV